MIFFQGRLLLDACKASEELEECLKVALEIWTTRDDCFLHCTSGGGLKRMQLREDHLARHFRFPKTSFKLEMDGDVASVSCIGGRSELSDEEEKRECNFILPSSEDPSKGELIVWR